MPPSDRLAQLCVMPVVWLIVEKLADHITSHRIHFSVDGSLSFKW